MLALSPDVLILDEPTSNLDPNATRLIFETLHHLVQQKGLTIIIIEHKLLQLVDLNPRVIVMENGRIKGEESVLTFLSELGAEMDSMPMERPYSKVRTDEEPFVSLSSVDLILGDKTILKEISSDLFPGEFISLMGPNGSGKTSLLLTLMGLIQIGRASCRERG